MQGEKSLLKDGVIKLAICVLCAFLYSAGGTEDMGGLWLRRYLMPLVFTGTLFYYSRDLRSFISLTMMGSLSLGYGADFIFEKIFKRAYCGLANALTSSGRNLTRKEWLLTGFHIVLVTSAFITFGVWNPFPNARIEELVLGFVIVFIPIMSAKQNG